MSAKVRKLSGYWTVVTHHDGRRSKRRIGRSAADKRTAEKVAAEINARIALGYLPQPPKDEPMPCDEELARWLRTYAPTFKRSTEIEADRIIRAHLSPHFGARDVRQIREADLLEYVQAKLAVGLAPITIRNHLSLLRRVLNLLVREEKIARNPASRIGELMRKVGRRLATETREVDSWTPREVGILLHVASETEPRFHPALAALFYTGMRRGELLALRWEDVDFDRARVHVRRAWSHGHLSTPKSGRGRRILLAPDLGSLLLDVMAGQREEALALGLGERIPWVFPNRNGQLQETHNFARTWRRVRNRAQKLGVRPLTLHSARHTWASLALSSGKSVRWVADQLGHADPALTLRVYAHVIPDAETDLSFLDFEDPGRPYKAPASSQDDAEEAAKPATPRRRKQSHGAPGTTRTCDPQFRKLVLYPTELRALKALGAEEASRAVFPTPLEAKLGEKTARPVAPRPKQLGQCLASL